MCLISSIAESARETLAAIRERGRVVAGWPRTDWYVLHVLIVALSLVGLQYFVRRSHEFVNPFRVSFLLVVIIGTPTVMVIAIRLFGRYSVESTNYWPVVRWLLLGTLGGTAIIGISLLDLYLRSIPTVGLVVLLLCGANIGSLSGVLIGLQTVRARQSIRRAERAETRADLVAEHEQSLLFLNRILRHHVLNRLSIIVGTTTNLRRGTVDDLDASLDTIDEECERMAEYVRDIRTVVRTLSAGVTPELVDLTTALKTEVARARTTFPGAGFDLEIPDDITVIGSELTATVFENVIENAAKHNDSPSPTVSVSAVDHDETVRVMIADNGVGIPDDRKTEYFQRGKHGQTSLGEGLGLYLAETVLTQTGGRIWIEDNEPRGTRVTIELVKAEAGSQPEDWIESSKRPDEPRRSHEV